MGISIERISNTTVNMSVAKRRMIITTNQSSLELGSLKHWLRTSTDERTQGPGSPSGLEVLP